MTKKVKELQKQNNQLDKNINLEYQGIFTEMICYIRCADISDYNQELVRRDLIEMVLSAQKRGESLNNLIGGDFKQFCDNIIAGLPSRTKKEKMLIVLNAFCIGSSTFIMLSIVISKNTFALLHGLLAKETVNYNIPITLGGLVSVIILLIFSVIILESITKNPLKKQTGLIVVGTIMGIFVLTAKFGQTIIFTVNIFIAIGVVVLLFIIHKLLSKV
ncbi:hypothetical protein DSECCO2_364480 [anaerobic digester metagenome]